MDQVGHMLVLVRCQDCENSMADPTSLIDIFEPKGGLLFLSPDEVGLIRPPKARMTKFFIAISCGSHSLYVKTGS